jgi:glycosyltransferase involved in cell wall biosynthesis
MGMKIAAMLRIRNEERWIVEVIASLLPIAERIFVLDDHSTDGTRELCRGFAEVELHESPFEGLDETRDKNHLLDKILPHDPEWVICVDGDEVLESNGAAKIRDLACRPAAAYSFRVLYLWDTPQTVRMDGVYGRFYRPSMFRLHANRKARFRTTTAGGNLHCSSVPQEHLPLSARTDVALLHYGYIDRDMRLRKYEYYNRVDPGNDNEDRYRHIVQGDIEAVPSFVPLRHAGPLKLQSLASV